MSERSNVIDLAAEREARSPHIAGHVRCLACKAEHVAVAPVGVGEQECPECGLMRAVWMWPLGLADGESMWVCNCGGELFVLTTTSPMCATCGASQSWEPIG